MNCLFRFLFGLTLIGTPANAAPSEDRYDIDDYDRVEKIDIHFHIRTDDPQFVGLAKADQFRFLSIVVHSPEAEELAERHRTSFAQLRGHPSRIAVASAFPMAGWDDPDWTEKTLQHLDRTFAQGAVAVKVWKNIGMEFRDRAGSLIMIDDPRFDPVFRRLQEKGIRLMGHLGEPKNCWLPLEEMTVENDRNYFSRNPQYHMHLHPDMPSYQDQITARDRMLAKHPDLRFIAAHLASLEWSVAEVARFLDRFPNAVAETAARMGQVQHQSVRDREKVRQFFIKYQDRILYGTDGGVRAGSSAENAYAGARRRWLSDWKYFCTEEIQEVSELQEPVQGLGLPKNVVDKIYRLNARKLFPTSWAAK